MDEQLKRRLIGATVLVALAIIFLPMLLSHKPVARHSGKMADIPVEPVRDFDPSLLQDAPPAKASSASTTPPKTPEPVAKAPTAAVAPAAPVVEAKPAHRPKPAVVSGQKPEKKIVKKVEKKSEKKAARPEMPASPFAWVVQVASFASRESADKLVKKLRKAGLDTLNPSTVIVGGKTYYRVRVGPEIDRKRAMDLLPHINRISGTKGQVVRYP